MGLHKLSWNALAPLSSLLPRLLLTKTSFDKTSEGSKDCVHWVLSCEKKKYLLMLGEWICLPASPFQAKTLQISAKLWKQGWLYIYFLFSLSSCTFYFAPFFGLIATSQKAILILKERSSCWSWNICSIPNASSCWINSASCSQGSLIPQGSLQNQNRQM